MSFRRLTEKGGLILLLNVLQVLLGMVRVILVTRALGPALRGVFSTFLNIPEITASIGNLGLGPSIIYSVSKRRENARRVVGSMILFAVPMAGMLSLLVYFLIKMNLLYKKGNVQLSSLAIFILLMIPVSYVSNLSEKLLLSLEMSIKASSLRIISSILMVSLFLALSNWVDNPLNRAVWATLISYGATVSFPFILIIPHGAYPPIFDISYTLTVLRHGLKSYPSQCFEILLVKSGIIFIAAFSTPEQAGFFAISARLAEISLLIPRSLIGPYIPMLYKMEHAQGSRFTPTVIKAVAFVMIMVFVFYVFLGRMLITLFFGSDFQPAYMVLLFLMPGTLCYSLYPFLRFDLFGRNITSSVSIASGAGFASFAVAAVFLVPQYAAIGGAISNSIGYAITLMVVIAIYCKRSKTTAVRLLVPSLSDMSLVRDAYLRMRNPSSGT